jgi:hypothetical protein
MANKTGDKELFHPTSEIKKRLTNASIHDKLHVEYFKTNPRNLTSSGEGNTISAG